MEKRCLFRAEVLQEIAECADQAQASNHGLQTVDEAPPPPPPPKHSNYLFGETRGA